MPDVGTFLAFICLAACWIDTAAAAGSFQEAIGQRPEPSWPASILNASASPVDLSFLNAPEAPAGKRGFLRAHGDELVFEDGTVARFWGTNLTAHALFDSSREAIERQAHRLSQLGFNLVRLHHHDSDWVDPNIFGGRNSPNTLTLDPAMLERLDWWIKCLKDEGIYVWLDLHVGRRFKPADGIANFSEISKGNAASLNGYNYVNDSIRDAMKAFNRAYLEHRNRFTSLRYADDPAIAALMITNENDITHHYGNALLPDKSVPGHTAIYLRAADKFAVEHDLPRDRVWRTWEDGPSKIFLNDLEERFDAVMIADLRGLGARAPIATTSSWGHEPLSSLPALTSGDVIDAHSYGGSGQLAINPIFGANLVHWIAAAQVLGMPLTVTEWGIDGDGKQASDRQSLPLYIAASAAFQGWCAVMFYAYAQESLDQGHGTPSLYQAYNDPALISSLPAAALLYRQAHVKEAGTVYVFAPSKQMLFDRDITAGNSVALRTASERGRLRIAMPRVAELPWLRPSAVPTSAKIITNPELSQLPANALESVSDTGELRHDWGRGTFTIDTPRTQAAMGSIGGRRIVLADVDVSIRTPNASIAVQTLDGKSIRQSRRIMISAAGRSVPRAERTLPYTSEPVEGTIRIIARPGMSLGSWNEGTKTLRRLATQYSGGHYSLTFDRSVNTSWLLLSEP